MKFRAS